MVPVTEILFLALHFYSAQVATPEINPRLQFLVLCHFVVQFLCITRLKSSLQMFYGWHHELEAGYGVSICTMKTYLFTMSVPFSLSSTMDLTSMSNSAGVFRKAEDTYTTGIPGRCSHFLGRRVAHLLLLLCMCYFGFHCALLCVSVFHVRSLSLDYILLIYVRILFPLITLF